MAIFQVNLGQLVLLKLRMMEVAVRTRAISRAKLQSNRHHQQPTFYRLDALPMLVHYVIILVITVFFGLLDAPYCKLHHPIYSKICGKIIT